MSRRKMHKVEWKVNTPGLLREILNNSGTDVLRTPLAIFGALLFQVGKRASELNDRQLNKLMLQLSIYAEGNPEHPKYNDKVMREYGL